MKILLKIGNFRIDITQPFSTNKVAETGKLQYQWNFRPLATVISKFSETPNHTIRKRKNMAGQNTFKILLLNDDNMTGEH